MIPFIVIASPLIYLIRDPAITNPSNPIVITVESTKLNFRCFIFQNCRAQIQFLQTATFQQFFQPNQIYKLKVYNADDGLSETTYIYYAGVEPIKNQKFFDFGDLIGQFTIFRATTIAYEVHFKAFQKLITKKLYQRQSGVYITVVLNSTVPIAMLPQINLQITGLQTFKFVSATHYSLQSYLSISCQSIVGGLVLTLYKNLTELNTGSFEFKLLPWNQQKENASFISIDKYCEKVDYITCGCIKCKKDYVLNGSQCIKACPYPSLRYLTNPYSQQVKSCSPCQFYVQRQTKACVKECKQDYALSPAGDQCVKCAYRLMMKGKFYCILQSEFHGNYALFILLPLLLSAILGLILAVKIKKAFIPDRQ